jgi:uncharacterized protein
MKRSGQADLPLHYGRVPAWLYERMRTMGLAITEAIVEEYGPDEFLRRISDPFWFQSFGAVLGMDWHSSGITTSVMGALKHALNPVSRELGIYICGGRGKHSRKTPEELLKIAERSGLDGHELVRTSKLTAKVDNTALQDGFQLYLHSFILTQNGNWAVVQQGMNDGNNMARRYHWLSENVRSFVDEPHTSVIGHNQGLILNLTAHEAESSRSGILSVGRENPGRMLPEIRKVLMPRHHEIKVTDVDLRRLGTVLGMAYDNQLQTFDDFLLLKGLGPKTLRSLTLVSEVIHGTPSRFHDPARFSFAHGGKDGHPFPVQTTVYDESIHFLQDAVRRAKIGETEKKDSIRKLSDLLFQLEKDFVPNPERFEKYIDQERKESKAYGGRTVFDDKKKTRKNLDDGQLKLF